MPKRIFITTFICIFFIQNTFCQDSVKIKKVKILPVPAFGYSPETRTYAGAVALFTFNFYNDTLTRRSNAKVEFNYTWNKQMILNGGWSFLSKGEKWFSKGEIYYSKYPDFYYGIGPNTPVSNKLMYKSNRFSFDANVLKKIKTNLFTGPNIKYINYWNVRPDASSPSYPELTSGSTVGIGYSILKDSRNSLLTPLRGVYAYANTTYNFSKNNYVELVLDGRYYKTWKEKFTIAGRFINDLNFGNPPFYDQAFLGGDKYVRGFFYGRYRDKNLSSLQLEFRSPLVWRFGFATFGGVSNLYPNLSGISAGNTKYNAGLGLRFLVDRKDNTNLRLDYAIGSNKNSGFYVAFGESF